MVAAKDKVTMNLTRARQEDFGPELFHGTFCNLNKMKMTMKSLKKTKVI